MCKAPKIEAAPAADKPEFLRNRLLDRALSGAGTVASLRTGRSRFRIPLGSTAGRAPGSALPQPNTPPPGVGPQPIGPRPIRRDGDPLDQGRGLNTR